MGVFLPPYIYNKTTYTYIEHTLTTLFVAFMWWLEYFVFICRVHFSICSDLSVHTFVWSQQSGYLDP